MEATNRHRELIADLAPKPAGLGKLTRRGSAAVCSGRHARDLRRPPLLRCAGRGLSKMLECGIEDAAGGLSISAIQNVDVEAWPDDEQYGQDANHMAKVADTA